jgi:sugar phosphate isomerase/epimerase
MNTMSVSTYSLRERLGRPMEFSFTDPSGKDVHLTFPSTGELGLSEFPARARTTFGVGAIETVAFQFDGLDDPELDRFADHLLATDVRLLNVAIDVGDLLEADPAKRTADIAEIKQWIDRCAEMGSTFVRVNPGSPMNPHAGQQPPRYLVEALRELGDYAAAKDTRLLVENHGGPSSNPAWMNKLLDAVGADRCGLLLDLGNFDALLAPAMAAFLGGADTAHAFDGVDTSSLYADIEALAPRAEHVHVKAHHVGDDGTVGAVDLVRAIGILNAHGYRGALSVEYEGTGGDPWAKSARVLEVAAAAARGTNR